MRFGLVVVLCLLLTACASPYAVSDALRQKSQRLNQSDAGALLRKHLSAPDEQAGVCQAVTNALHHDSKFLKLDDNMNLYTTGKVSEVVGVKPEIWSLFTTSPLFTAVTEYKGAILRVNLKTISSVRVKDKRLNPDEVIDCPQAKGSVSLWIKSDDTDFANAVILKVADGNLDEVLAALLALSPEAKLKAGVGM